MMLAVGSFVYVLVQGEVVPFYSSFTENYHECVLDFVRCFFNIN